MKLFNILVETAPAKVVVSLLVGTLAGVGYAFLIPIVLNSFDTGNEFPLLHREPVGIFGLEVSNYKFAALFFFSCLVIITARTLSQLTLSWVAIDATSDLRIKYYNGILKAPIAKLEKVGAARLIASITTDVKTIVQGALRVPDLLISTVDMLGMLLFLLYLNPSVFYFVCGAILFGGLTFQVPMLLGARFFRRSRDKVDDLHDGIRGNIFGVKELKLCAARRAEYLRELLLEAEDDVRKANRKGLTILRGAMNYGEMISFFVIGFVAFVFVNYHSVSQEELLGAIMVLLYVTGPISTILGAIPDVVTANVSLIKVEELFASIPEEDIDEKVRPLKPWRGMRFTGLTYRYADSNGDEGGFSIGPLNLDLRQGQVTFIVGGNGSGKSTLGKLITSHYLPSGGTIHLDDLLIDRSSVNSFRNQVSAITTDYYLFDRLLGAAKDADAKVVEKYLKRLQLDQKVSLENGRFSTLSLSDGQRKRLALLISLLEDKQLYLFDEWAADQDPEFKRIFYHEILPHLRARNKVVVVISHDDRYFDVGDRIFIMENGSLREKKPPLEHVAALDEHSLPLVQPLA